MSDDDGEAAERARRIERSLGLLQDQVDNMAEQITALERRLDGFERSAGRSNPSDIMRALGDIAAHLQRLEDQLTALKGPPSGSAI